MRYSGDDWTLLYVREDLTEQYSEPELEERVARLREALSRRDRAEPSGAQLSDAEPERAPEPSEAWLDAYDDEGVRNIFAHLATHGAITESECTSLLGSPRKFRRFSRRIEQLSVPAPFDVRVEH